MEDALEFATVLLDGDGRWNRQLIDEAIAGGKTETVFLKEPLPVLIVYGPSASAHPASCVSPAMCTDAMTLCFERWTAPDQALVQGAECPALSL